MKPCLSSFILVRLSPVSSILLSLKMTKSNLPSFKSFSNSDVRLLVIFMSIFG